MINIKNFVIILISISQLSSCSKDSGTPNSSQNEIMSMKINGQAKQFQFAGRGLSFYNGEYGTLRIDLFTGVLSPQQDSYAITLELPYKGIGNNIIKEIRYFRVKDATSIGGDFVQGQLQSNVKENTELRFSATFSGSTVIDGNKISITEGIINHVYEDPF